MTKEQLELLLKYIDMRDNHYNHVAKTPEGYSLGYSDEEMDIRQDLRETIIEHPIPKL
jgi:arginyl-tRNA--protein-N-Asp/Glu arginylyltransferase